MSSRLDDLMRLARKTGDTLIIHDKDGEDMVIMDVFRYEMLHDISSMNDVDPCNHNQELYDMSEGELIDKINRDIAIWRSHREDDEISDQGHALEEQLKENPLPDPFEEDYIHGEDWHRAGSVLENRHPEFSKDEHDDEFGNTDFFSDDDTDDWDDNGNEDWTPDVMAHNDETDLDNVLGSNGVDGNRDLKDDDTPLLFAEDAKWSDTDLRYDPLGQDQVFSEKSEDKRDVAFMSHHEELDFKEEPINDDEPMFFEEPV